MASAQANEVATSPSFVALFKDALTAYQVETKRNLQLDTLEKTLKSPEDLLAYIESQGESFKHFRSKHGKLWSRMQTVLRPVATIGSIFSQALNSTAFGLPACAVLGAVLYLIKAADGVTDAYDWIQTLFGEFEMFAIRLQEYISPSRDMNSALQDRLGAILICMLRLFGRAEVLIQAGRFREYLKTAFLGKDDKTKNLLDELNVQLKNEQGLILALTFNATRNAEEYSKSAAESGDRIEARLNELTLSHAQLVSKLDEEKKKVSDDQIKEMKQMLENPAVDIVARLLSTQKRDLVKGTGAWLLKEAHFSTWIRGMAPILWILGGPGSGKSFLATWTILHLQDHFRQQTDSLAQTAVAYFFIKDYDTALVNGNSIMKTLALQIAEVDMAFGRYVATYCMDRDATITEDDTWESLFVGFYSSVEARDHYAILILDGLDEAPAQVRKKLLAMAKSVTGSRNSTPLGDHIQFGIFGRSELRSDFEINRQEKFIMVSLKNQDDIKNFILSRLSDISLVQAMEGKGPAGQKQARKLRDTITRKVLLGADGVFLWAKLLMKELEDLNAVQIGRVLQNPPQSLDEMISKLFHRISQDESVDNDEVTMMMLLICFAKRPLLFGELKLFLSLPNQPPDILLWRTIRGRLASLFELKYHPFYDPDAIQDSEDDQTNTSLASSEGSVAAEGTSNDDECVSGVDTIESHEISEEDKEDDEAEDFDFGDDSNSHAVIYDLGFVPSSHTDAREYANTIHDSEGQLKTTIRFTHQRIKDFLIASGDQTSTSFPPKEIRINIQRAEIDMTIKCLQALQLSNEKKDHRAYLVEYPAKNFVLHLANVQEEYLTNEDTNEILMGLVNLFHSDQKTKAFLVAAETNIFLSEADTGRDEFWTMWMSRQDHRKLVQEWLQKPEIEALVSDQDVLAWIQRARRSSTALLEPLMRGASEIWLTKSGYDDEAYRDKSGWLVDLLRAFVSMDETGTISDNNYQNWSWLQERCSPPASIEQLYEVAEWAALEKTTHWHTGLGWIMMELGLHDQAIVEYDKAIELDSKAWVAMEGKARSLNAQQKYEETIAVMTKAIQNVPSSMSEIRAYLYPWISSSKQALGDLEGARDAAAEAYALDKGSRVAQEKYISTLCDIKGSYQDVVDLLEQLHDVYGEAGISWLAEFFYCGYDLYDKIGLACKECGRPSFLLEAIDQALEWSQDKTSTKSLIMMTRGAARVQYHYYSHDDEAVQLYERALILMTENTSKKKMDDLSDRVTAQNALSLILFDMAVAAKRENQGYSRLSTRLKELSLALDSSLDSHSFEFYNTGYPSLLWGRWLREHEGADETVWRKPFRARLLDQISMLDDDDPANDSYALKAVATTLFHAGDRENAGAIFAILFKLLEDFIEERDAQLTKSWIAVEDDMNRVVTKSDAVEEASSPNFADTTDGASELNYGAKPVEELPETTPPAATAFIGPQEATLAEIEAINTLAMPKAEGMELKLAVTKDDWMYTCDNCGKDAEAVAELYFCEICYVKNWCDECLPMVKSGTLPRRECSPEHTFYRAWPIPEESRHMAATWLEGEPRLRREWLEALRAQWL